MSTPRLHFSAASRRLPAAPRPSPLTAALALVFAAGMPLAASAAESPQQAQDAQQTQQVAADSGTTEDARTLDSVTVTGTRIRRKDGMEGPTPLVQISEEQISATGRTQIADVVNQMPALSITQSNQTANLEGNPGINALDLRGLGTQRTLVLVDGRRQVPAMPGTSAIDLSTIPSSLVQRVDIVTGGASALYGADAVSGVANFILKKDFEGINGGVYYGNSSRGDMPTTNFDLLMGKNFADQRGNVTFYAFHEDSPGTVSGQDRPWTADGYPTYQRPNSGALYEITDGIRNIYNSTYAQAILGGKHYAFTADGRLRDPILGPGGYANLVPVKLDDPAGALYGLATDGGEYGGRYDSWYLSVPSQRDTLRMSFNFDASEALRFFGNATYARNESESGAPALALYGYDYVPVDSPFITDEMREANGGSIDEDLSVARRFDEAGLSRSRYHYGMFQMHAGVSGDFQFLSRDWNYSAYVSYGRSTQRARDWQVVSYDRFQMGLDSTTDDNGNPVCRSTLDEPGNGCVAINPFKTLTPEMLAWLRYDTDWSHTKQTQKVASAYVGGGLFDLPAGEVQMVVGGEYRKEDSDIGAVPQYDPSSPSFDPTLGSESHPLKGGYSVKEIFAEMHVPLLADVAFAKRLDFDVAARVSDYDRAGRTVTNKFGLDWAPIEDISLRATYGRAVRAPNIGEMFTARGVGGAWLADPCNYYDVEYRTTRTQYTKANCEALNPANANDTYWIWTDVISQGNLDLKPEVAKTLTAGLVFRPRFLRNFVMSVDYYDIDLTGAIDAFPAQTLLNKCVDAPTLDNVFCDQVIRDDDNNLTGVITQKLNLAKYLTRGIDYAAQYRYDLTPHWGEKAGTLNFSLSYTRLIRKDYTFDPDQPDEVSHFAGVFGAPRSKGVLSSSWYNDSAGVTWTLRHVGKMRNSTQVTPELYRKVWAGSVYYNDFYGYFNLKPGLQIFGGLYNAFDRAPPRIPGGEAGGANFELGYQAGVYDVIGRMYYAGARVNF
ncbi:MAG: TonB-dependent receptor [Pseudoxanthomonas sp.]